MFYLFAYLLILQLLVINRFFAFQQPAEDNDVSIASQQDDVTSQQDIVTSQQDQDDADHAHVCLMIANKTNTNKI